MSLEKYIYCKVFNTEANKINVAFMKTHYGKINVVYNNKIFVKYLTEGKYVNDKNYFDEQNKIQKMEYVIKMINKLGFNGIDKSVKKGLFDKKISDMLEVVDDPFRILFNMKKEEVDKLNKKYNTNKKILGFINTIIGEYGITIRAIKETKYNKEAKKMNICNIAYYALENIKIIKNIS